MNIEMEVIAPLLQKTFLFSAWTEKELQEIIFLSEIITVEEGKTIFSPGEQGSKLYCILNGNILILSDSEKSLLAEFVAGEIFGESELLTETKYNAYAVAGKKTEVLAFPKSGVSLDDIAKENPALFAHLLKSFLILIAQRTRQANALIKENSPIMRELRKQVYGDKLTGLLNKAYIEENLSKYLKNDITSLIMMKPDNFKYINDNFGHKAGDAILVLIANNLSHFIHTDSVLIRYQGNEFAVITPSTSREKALSLAEEIQNFLHTLDISSVTMKDDVFLSMSLGIALYPEHAQTAEALIARCVNLPLDGRLQGGGKILFPEADS
ncbi:GGDEF domain-containing protein [Treponema phagedenis]|uniref:diguanylate cyclase n=1 Tax=Treponema phagedenis TaxID=162 RepID=A0AAE6M832_TREPH|nr:GGDEF domain-containing protein [Treponema phagedenis]NVP25258.1 GGDEF domain-containing protein [Treponema phagedenis]QEJ93921.1 GGDEF domain-containing protein [Treponema phagedenis]QEJ97067.1 GGDEF domain-containing protein [Treponema phagedenis]QKS91284.1 GGDEF domain-containing protein [Treponema phagedenis]QLC59947.1 GGDEF domain-containing protein [Treponema phagedenis]